MSNMSALVAERLRRFVRRLKKDDDLHRFITILNGAGEAYLFGGAPRDVAFGVGTKIHDLDIFVSGGIDAEELGRYSKHVRRTNFGGFRLIVGKFEVDAWELDKSYAFRLNASSHVSVRNLLNTVCFSTDGIAVSLKSGRSNATPQFLESLSSRRLDFIVPPPRLDPVVGARIARLALKLSLELAPAVSVYFVQCLEEIGIGSMIDAEARWGEHRILSEISMEQIKSEVYGEQLARRFRASDNN